MVFANAWGLDQEGGREGMGGEGKDYQLTLLVPHMQRTGGRWDYPRDEFALGQRSDKGML